MNILSVENLAKSYGERVLFENVSFGLVKGQKVAVVAKNGSGKSTMFQLLMDPNSADSGNVIFRDGVRIGYLNQDSKFPEDLTIEEAILQSSGEKVSMLNRYNQMIENGELEGDEFNDLVVAMENNGVWELEGKMKEILGNLKVHDIQRKIGELSGGQLKRVALAALLLDEPDLMLLDEPTNHLDFDMIEWLEQYLNNPEFTILLITHDRYFLDAVCNEIIEIDLNQIFSYKGGYIYYLEKKADREFNAQRVADKAKSLLKTELEWYRRMPKARTTKSKSRMDNVHEIKKVATSVKKSKSLEIDAKFSRLGSKICEFNKVSHSFGDLKILDKFDYVFKKGEKIGIVGGNGTGKSTFLKILTQELEPNTGTVDIGETIVLGHYKQEGLTFRPDFKVIDVLKEFAEIVELRDGKKISASQLLTQFHFDPKVQHNLVSKLSGGEKRRLYLLTILIQSPNFLILDEPTNDLDLDTLSTLEEYLMDFPGCLIIVSHDRSFLDRLSDHLFVFKGNAEIKDFPGTYTQYREKYKQEVKEKKKEVVVDKAPKEKVKKDNKKVSYKVQFEFDQTEKRMEELEAKKLELEAKVANESLETDALMEVSNEIGKIVDELDELFIRWSELSEEME